MSLRNTYRLKRRRHEKTEIARWRKALAALSAELMASLAGVTDVDQLRGAAKRPINQTLITDTMAATYRAVGTDFAITQAKELRRLAGKKSADIYDVDFWDEHFNQLARTKAAAKVSGIVGTTTEMYQSIIDRVIREGQESGLSISEMTRKIGELLEDNRIYRAERIARTEIMSISNAAQEEAALLSDIPCEKGWLHSGGANEREEHAALDGVYIGLTEFFNVGGEMMPRPGEGSAENVINCRCALDIRPIEQNT